MIVSNKIGLGLSSSSWSILQRLKNSGFINQVALTNGASSSINKISEDILVGNAKDILANNWHKDSIFIVVGAVGAVTRLVATLLTSKENDPAVIVIDSNGLHVVPLLGGHQSGGEKIAIQLEESFGAVAAITGDSSSQQRLSIDSFGNDWGWIKSGNIDDWNQLMINQSKGEKIEVEQTSGSNLWIRTKSASKSIQTSQGKEFNQSNKFFIGSKLVAGCSWHPATLWIGIGCEKNTSQSLIDRSIKESLYKAKLAKQSIAGISSIDIKSDETALIEIANKNSWPIRFFNSKELSSVKVPNPSLIVTEAVGTPSVAESSAILAAGKDCILILQKQIFRSIENESGALTIAIAESCNSFSPQRGELHLVGSGPGDLAFITSDAKLSLARSSIWIGYSLYLDLLEPLRRDYQVRINSELTRERERCDHAIELATQGARVSLISSGDSGIYGMAGLALEILLTKPHNERPKFEIHPGISAIQLAASRLGAPLMKDFCVVSLSDYLIPWPVIKSRLKAAAIGDFVIGLYNPKSKDRDWQLKSAIELLMIYRPSSTPIALARHLGRKDENIDLYTLSTIPINDVDMFSLLIVGNTESLISDGWFLNPRGYSIN